MRGYSSSAKGTENCVGNYTYVKSHYLCCYELFACKFKFYAIQAFDQHLNMVLGEVEESVITREVDLETEEEIVKVR